MGSAANEMGRLGFRRLLARLDDGRHQGAHDLPASQFPFPIDLKSGTFAISP
jgi:hypothetical protein